jgi:DNA-binding NtrC family response regulator
VPTSTEEAIAFLQDNPGKFAVIISDYKREHDPKQGYGLLDEMKSRNLHIPFIFYVADHTEDQAKEAVRYGARAEVNDPIELLSEVLRALPPEAKEPGRFELLEQKFVGCRWMWREPP